MDAREKAAGISVLSNTLLVLGKLAVGYWINSISVMSEAIHSGLDLVAAVIAFFAVRLAIKPADKRHRYGHGKIENVSGTIEALLIFTAAAWIIYEAVKKLLLAGSHISLPLAGVVVMAASGFINYIVSGYLFRVAAKTDSIALEADAWHLRTDVYTSLGVTVSLLAIYFTGYHLLDPLMALLVAVMIIKAAWKLTCEALSPLMDVSLPEHEEQAIIDVIAGHSNEFVEFHKLRTRKAGRERKIDLHLVVPYYKNINEVHNLCDNIGNEIKEALPYSDVLIHAEPCNTLEECRSCGTCTEKEKRSKKSK